MATNYKLRFLLMLIFCITLKMNILSQNVSTEISKKSILLEEFTGIYCGNCPDGHTVARNLKNANENTYVIAIHSGYFAVPNDDHPDYRIPEGEIIDNYLGAETYGYPSGTINRTFFGNRIVLGRENWIKSGKAIYAEDAPVNILLTATYDGSNRKLSVKTEGYYTMEVEEESNWLNIVVTQNNIIGPQSGIGGGLEYVHNRMLRCFITPMDENIWGEEIESPEQGKFFEFEYEFDLPYDINGVQIMPEDIEIIAFVCADKTEVLNVTGIKPDYINYEKPFDATLLKPAKEIGTRYGYHFFDAQLKNLSHIPIITAKFDVNINGNVQEVEWTSEIPAFQTKPVTLSVEPYTINAANQYSIKLTALNDENIDGNVISGSFVGPIEATQNIFIEIRTDRHADENRFLIRDLAGNIVAEFGPYQTNLATTYNETVTLNKDQTYCFEVIDQWWDGMQDPRGHFKLHSEDLYLIVQAYDVRLHGDRVFFHTSKDFVSMTYNNVRQNIDVFYNNLRQTVDISFYSDTDGVAEISLYNVLGTLLTEKSFRVEEGKIEEVSLPVSKYGKGIYLLKIVRENQNITRKVIIY